ncbi:unnamed protein product [Orchesella dallaii]|uniref:Major facilitator superfamily (MFS) profile domain-containing protein n=1 Tax=Orchesella dallaii TaxID=48710 RepID=A0ABP1R096_9HEXA
MDTDPVLEDVMRQLGDFGPYQLRQHLLHVLTSFLAGIHMLSLHFVAPTPEHRCYIEQVDSGGESLDSLHKYIPLDSNGQLDACLKYDGIGANHTVVSCDGHYFYNTTYYTSSRVIDWDLVCDRRWMRALLQSVYMFGVGLGAYILGSMADTMGRKPILYLSGIFQLIFGIICAFMPYYSLLAVSLFFYGAFGSGGAYVTGFVLSMELVGASKRTVCGTAFSFTFALGVMLVALWAFLIPNFQVLQIVYAAHSLLLIAHWCLVDESIRWLWGQNRKLEALEIAEKAVQVNGKYFVNHYQDALSETPEVATSAATTDKEEAKGGMLNMFRHPNLRYRALNVAYNWFANSLVYYGLSFNTGTLPGNPFFIFFLNGLAELPGYAIVIGLVDKTGRRSLSSLLLFVGGFSCVVIAYMSKGALVTTIAMIAKIAVSGSFAIIYNYTAELFPTVVRNSAVGLSSIAARTSGMLTPQIILLDSIGKELPSVIFGVVAMLAAFFALFLPETLNKEMPQTLEDGENFGRGDTAFRTMWRFITRRKDPVDSITRLR